MKPSDSKISVIIPVLNEAQTISKTLEHLKASSSRKLIKEVLVVDGGSTDKTVELAIKQGASVLYTTKGRAKQMNYGARFATGDILYFLHVDTLTPLNFDQQIIDAVQGGTEAGCFQMKFDNNSHFLNFFAWLTKINLKICRGGDQSLFITKKLFHKTGGYDENYIIYEDYKFIARLYEITSFTVLSSHVVTSARKYEKYGVIKLQYHFGMIHLKNFLGASPKQLHDYYSRNISY